MVFEGVFLAIFWVLVFGFGAVIIQSSISQHIVQERLFRDEYVAKDVLKKKIRNTPIHKLLHWLKGAGLEYRRHVIGYAAAITIFFILSLLVIATLNRSNLIPMAASALLSIPGDIGRIFIPIILACPYVIGVMIILAPYMFVRRLRATRERQIEQDLPILLEFMVTLSSAGIAFDEALVRVLKVFTSKRPISKAFAHLQKEILAGQSRLSSFWNLRDRLQTVSVRNFVSALIQSEKRGGSINEVLRQQMTELTSRRRFKAMEMTAKLPVKLLFPMMVCFLPGIFVVTLGPALYEFIQVLDTILVGLR